MYILTTPIFLYLIGICLFLSILVENKSPLKKILPIFFSVLLLVECICYYLKTQNLNNLIVYNFWFPIEFVLYTFWIINYLDSKRGKKIFILLIPFYLIGVIVIYFFSSTLLKFNSLAFQLGFLLLLPVALIKLYELINQVVISNPIKTSIFWLITGILVSYFFSLAQFSIQNYLHLNNKDLLEALKKINFILADILYTCIIIYFLLKWKNKKLYI